MSGTRSLPVGVLRLGGSTGESARRPHARIQQAERQVHAESHGIYGSRKIAISLREQPELESACRNTVARAMRKLRLKSRLVRRFAPLTTQRLSEKKGLAFRVPRSRLCVAVLLL